MTLIKRFAKIRHWHRRGNSYTASIVRCFFFSKKRKASLNVTTPKQRLDFPCSSKSISYLERFNPMAARFLVSYTRLSTEHLQKFIFMKFTPNCHVTSLHGNHGRYSDIQLLWCSLELDLNHFQSCTVLYFHALTSVS